MTLACSTCAAPITKHSRTGMCKPCACKSPIGRRQWSPEARANASAARKARWARELADPVMRAKAVESGKRLRAAHPSTPEMVEKQNAGRRRSQWIPDGYEEFNRQLKRKRFTREERQAIIATEVADQEAKRLASLSPLERQMERLAAGARLVAKPNLRKADPTYTMGGVATGQL